MRLPCNVAKRESATFVAVDHGARRIPKRTGTGVRRVAVSQRDRSFAVELPAFVRLNNSHGIPADTDVAGFERAAFLPDGAAELPAPRRDFLTPENIDTDSVLQNFMLKVTKNVRPQPAARGPSLREGFAVLTESFVSVTL